MSKPTWAAPPHVLSEIYALPIRKARLRYQNTVACKAHKMGEGNVCENCGASQSEVMCTDNTRKH